MKVESMNPMHSNLYKLFIGGVFKADLHLDLNPESDVIDALYAAGYQYSGVYTLAHPDNSFDIRNNHDDSLVSELFLAEDYEARVKDADDEKARLEDFAEYMEGYCFLCHGSGMSMEGGSCHGCRKGCSYCSELDCKDFLCLNEEALG